MRVLVAGGGIDGLVAGPCLHLETWAKGDDRWIRVSSLNDAIEAYHHPERFPVIVGASCDAEQAGGVKELTGGGD